MCVYLYFFMKGPVSPVIHIAVKNNVEVFYFLAECPLHVFLSPDGALEKSAYLAAWKVRSPSSSSSSSSSLM